MDFLNSTKKKAVAAVLPVFLGASGCTQMAHKTTAPQTDLEAFCRAYADQITGTVRDRAVDAGVGTAIGAGVGAGAGALIRNLGVGTGAIAGAVTGFTGKMIQQDSAYSRAFNECKNNPQYYKQPQQQQPQTGLPQTKPTVPGSVTPNTDGSRRYQGPIVPGVR